MDAYIILSSSGVHAICSKLQDCLAWGIELAQEDKGPEEDFSVTIGISPNENQWILDIQWDTYVEEFTVQRIEIYGS